MRLADDSLYCVFRVIHHAVLCSSRSDDEGRSWSHPEPLSGPDPPSGVEPKLLRLNGLVVLTAGRPGIYLWVSADPQAGRWTRWSLIANHNAKYGDATMHYASNDAGVAEAGGTTSYTGLVPLSASEVLVSYDWLNGWACRIDHGRHKTICANHSAVFTTRVQLERASIPNAR